MGLVSIAGAALTKPELGRMKPKLTNPESPDFSRGECQISFDRGYLIYIVLIFEAHNSS